MSYCVCMNNATRSLGQALCAKLGCTDWCTMPGGFSVKGHGFVSTAKARALTGIKSQPRVKKPLATSGSGGEWNAFASLVLASSAGRLPR